MRKYLAILLILLLAITCAFRVLIKLNGFRESIFDGPSVLQSMTNSIKTQPALYCPIFHAHCFTLKCQQVIVAFVASLFAATGPSTVFWLIVTVVIWKSVKCFTLGPFSHIGQKVREVQPSPTNRDSTAAIMMIAITRWIGASLNHMAPRHVGGTFVLVPRVAVGSHDLFVQAATRLSQSFLQAIARCREYLPAQTLAFSHWSIGSLFDESQCRHTIKNLPSNIFGLFDFWFMILLSHVVHSLSSVNDLIRAVRVFKHSFGSLYFNTGMEYA